jgi:L-lactate dehydrogenase complex protein LldG
MPDAGGPRINLAHSSTARQEMLNRVRGALGLPAGQSSRPENLSDWPGLGPVVPPPPSSDLASSFEIELVKVGGSPHRASNRNEIIGILSGILKEPASGVVMSHNPLLDPIGLESILSEMAVPVWKWTVAAGLEHEREAALDYRGRCFSAGAGITGVDFALVESGTLVLTSVTEGSQLASLAPPVHIAFYRRNQVLATLEEVLAQLPASRPGEASSGRSIVFVTGTSRTADIEQILIRGVHGPKELHAVLIDP